jgi:hypothetical protein
MVRAKEEREKEKARLRRRVRYHENDVRTKEEKGEGAEVPKVPIEAMETTSGRGRHPNGYNGPPFPTTTALPDSVQPLSLFRYDGREGKRFAGSEPWDSRRISGPVPPNNKGSVMRTAAAAVRAEFFEHKRLSPCVDQNGNGLLAVVLSADEVQFNTVGRRAYATASSNLCAAEGEGGSELHAGHVNVSEDDGRKKTTTATTPTASARIFVEMAALSPINGRSKSEGVRGPGAVRRDIPACANAFKSTKPSLLRSPRSAAVSLIAPDGSGVTYAEAMLTVRR